MKASDLQVFVYGTLKPGGRYWPRFCEGKVSNLVAAKVRGQLFDLPVGYPALVAGGDDWAWGCVLSFRREADFAEVDRLEGFDPWGPPAENEYQRIKVETFTSEGEALGPVWTYVMDNAKVHRLGGARIEDGDWPVR